MRTHEFMALVREVVASKPSDYVYPKDPKTAVTRLEYRKALNAKRAEGDTYDYTMDSQSSDGCFYRQHDGTPGCVVGNIVARILPDLELTENKMVSQLPELHPEIGKTFTFLQLEKLSTLQNYQDVGHAWPDAYAQAFGEDSWFKAQGYES